MLTIDRRKCRLLVVDFQTRLMPAIHQGEMVVANARRLLDGATLLGVPILFTEQNTTGLGPTIAGLNADASSVAHKMTFDAVRAPGFIERLPAERAIVVAGCEAHVCVLQTVLGLLHAGRKVYLARDALGSRHVENKEAAIRRMEHHGAEVVTTEMVLFEWLGTADDPAFRDVIRLVK